MDDLPMPILSFNGQDLRGSDFMDADLRLASFIAANLRCANMCGADLSDVQLDGADLTGANLRGAVLDRCSLAGANLTSTDLTGANLRWADLRSANLTGSVLAHADLRGVQLQQASIVDVDVRGCHLSRAVLGNTTLDGVNLSLALELDEMQHDSPCAISLTSLDITAQAVHGDSELKGKIELFLRNSLPDDKYIQVFRDLIPPSGMSGSAFLSYSHKDTVFAHRLHRSFRRRGIQCWIDEHHLLPGQRIHQEVGRAIRRSDKVVLCCSEASLNSWWVETEILAALEKERLLRARDSKEILVLIPLNLDDYLFTGWDSGLAPQIRSRLAADFRGWANNKSLFRRGLERVLVSLRNQEDT
ncbi:MAG: toll/interleukin-1 receptor domain-containing protein [bacterium]